MAAAIDAQRAEPSECNRHLSLRLIATISDRSLARSVKRAIYQITTTATPGSY